MDMDKAREAFLNVSVHLTGFNRAELLGTGMLAEYYDRVVSAIGDAASQELWAINEKLDRIERTDKDSSTLTDEIQGQLMSSKTLGPIARNIIKLWYWGSWPDEDAKFGGAFTSAQAYQQGLLWKAMGTHPQGAKQPGFGSWSKAPVKRTPQPTKSDEKTS